MDEEATAAAAALGMTEELQQQAKENLALQPVDLWPENYRPVLLARGMGTQWRVGNNGLLGFDYAALPVVEDRIAAQATSNDQKVSDFAALQYIESIMLTALRTK